MKILEVENFSKTFQIHQLDRAIEVFCDLSFTLQRGQFTLVSGANGAGKSTLLRCLYRTYRPTNGQAIYHARRGTLDLARAADVDIALLRREEIGFVTQFLRPRPRVTALEMVAEPLLAAGLPWDEAQPSASQMLSTFGLKPELWQAYPTTFSGGEQQKVNLARALIAPRRLLLLDEPTASLDAATRVALRARLVELKSQGVAMIGVLHHPEDVQELIDERIHLSNSQPYLVDELPEVAYVA
jgi:alpha-D-ribose 1-methylphosphonate 5-triphosphate synthase subunit PhnL